MQSVEGVDDDSVSSLFRGFSAAPAIGSIVHVMLEERCRAAIVTEVQDRDVISATVFRPLLHPLGLAGLHKSGARIHLSWHWPE